MALYRIVTKLYIIPLEINVHLMYNTIMIDKTLIGIRTRISDSRREMLRDITAKMNDAAFSDLTPKKSLETLIQMNHVLAFPEKYNPDIVEKWRTYAKKMYVLLKT